MKVISLLAQNEFYEEVEGLMYGAGHSVPEACKSGPKMDPKSANVESFYIICRWKK